MHPTLPYGLSVGYTHGNYAGEYRTHVRVHVYIGLYRLIQIRPTRPRYMPSIFRKIDAFPGGKRDVFIFDKTITGCSEFIKEGNRLNVALGRTNSMFHIFGTSQLACHEELTQACFRSTIYKVGAPLHRQERTPYRAHRTRRHRLVHTRPAPG